MKTSYFNTLSIIFFLQLGLAASVSAGEHTEHNHKEKADEKKEAAQERVQHGSHEHGKAKLTIAKTETGMEIMLDTPAANIFGFGHPANDKEERKIVQVAEEKLNAGDTLFIANNVANCKLKNVDIESDVISSLEKEEHDDHDEDLKKEDHAKDKDHDEDHKNEDHAKDKDHDEDHKNEDYAKDKDHDEDHKSEDHAKHEDHDDHNSSDDNKNTHSDVEVTWVFHCEKPKALKSVEVKLFSQFPKGFQYLNIEWISSKSAGTVELEADGSVRLK